MCTLEEQGHNIPLWGTNRYLYRYLYLTQPDV